MRGEYTDLAVYPAHPVELPPRARRIHSRCVRHPGTIGTTSACAENTDLGYPKKDLERNYLRVRGEYRGYQQQRLAFSELPPRARRIHPARVAALDIRGTTSACAENTPQPQFASGRHRNYLRVRGEYRGWYR